MSLSFKFSIKSVKAHQKWIDQLSEKVLEGFDRGTDSPTDHLDSSLKKHMVVLKKVKLPLSLETNDQLLQTVGNLKMEKFLNELAVSFAVKVPKLNSTDCAASVEIVVHLHQRFPNSFTNVFLEKLKAELQKFTEELSSPKPEPPYNPDLWTESSRTLELLPRLEYYTEFMLVKMLNQPGILQKFLKLITKNDLSFVNAPAIALFCRNYKELLSPSEVEVLIDYFKKMTAFVQSFWKDIQNQQKMQSRSVLLYGKMFEGAAQKLQSSVKGFKAISASASELAEALAQPVPQIEIEDEPSQAQDGGKVTLIGVQPANATAPSIWESGLEKELFGEILDLATVLSPDILGKRKSNLKQHEAETDVLSDMSKGAYKLSISELLEAPDPETESLIQYLKQQRAFRTESDKDADDAGEFSDWSDDESGKTKNVPGVSESSEFDALFARFGKISKKEDADELAVECIKINNPNTRRRILKSVVSLEHFSKDKNVAPRYLARFMAIMYPYCPEIGDALVVYLLSRIGKVSRFAKRRVLPRYILRMLTFLCDLMKAGVCYPGRVLSILHYGALDFERGCLQIVCFLLSRCGRFLYHNKLYYGRMSAIMQIIERKRRAKFYQQFEQQLIENALFDTYCRSQDEPKIGKEIPVAKAFLQDVFFVSFPAKLVTEAQVLQLLLTVDMSDPVIHKTLLALFTKPWKHSLLAVPMLSQLLSRLMSLQPRFVGKVLDLLLERVYFALETNDPNESQKRVATVNMLGDLYAAKVLPRDSFLSVLKRLMLFGHTIGTRYRDNPKDYFRINLICCLLLSGLKTKEQFRALFVKIQQNGVYLASLYQYISTKRLPLPADVAHILREVADKFVVDELEFVLSIAAPNHISKPDSVLAAPSRDAEIEAESTSDSSSSSSLDDASSDGGSCSGDSAVESLSVDDVEGNLSQDEEDEQFFLESSLAVEMKAYSNGDQESVARRSLSGPIYVALKSGKKTTLASIESQ